MIRLLQAGILAICLGAAAHAQVAKQPTPKSQAEIEAIQAIFQAQSAEERIKAGEQLIVKFADTEFKALALFLIAASYEQMNDFDKMAVYAEQVLKEDPQDYKSMLMLARGIAVKTREHDLDRDEKLARSEKYAKQALEVLKTAPKPNPELTDEQWDGAKKDFEAQAHEAYAAGAMARKDLPKAMEHYKAAYKTQVNPDPVLMIRYAQAANMASKPDEAIAVLDEVTSMADLHPSLKTAAEGEKQKAIKMKTAQ